MGAARADPTRLAQAAGRLRDQRDLRRRSGAIPRLGGYGSSKAALDQLTAVLAAEHRDLRIYAVDPGDMRTRMHQQAFPGEDISDRPLPETSVPGMLALVDGSLPSGRYRAREIAPLVH